MDASTRMRDSSLRIVFALTVFLVVLVALDLVAWAFIHRGKKCYGFHDRMLYLLPPNSSEPIDLGEYFPEYWMPNFTVGKFSVGEEGFRVPNTPVAKEPGEFRVICMGDSSTMGLGVDDNSTYPAQLEICLGQALPGVKVKVMNAGILGYSSRQGLLLYREHIARYKPDLVIWAYGFNDAASIPLFSRMDARLILLDPSRQASWLDRIQFLIYRQPIFHIIHNGLFTNIFRIKLAKLMANLNRINQGKEPVENHGQYIEARVPPNDYAEGLIELKQIASRDGFSLICMNLNRLAPPYAKITRVVCQVRQIPFLDLEARFNSIIASGKVPSAYRSEYEPYRIHRNPQAATNDTLLLTVDGLHPNVVGCRLIAEDLASFILHSGFDAIPGSPPPSPD